MQDYPGTFIALEGSDGSGKGTQFKLLTERLKAVGYDVETFDFPRYEEASSHFVKRYLNGDYGPASQISPYSASLFYALDRFEAAPQLRKALQQGKVVLSNRYVGSNMAHQGGKFTSEAEQRGFFIWADSLEYQLLGIPRPIVSLFLRVPAEVSYRLISNKAARSYTDKKHDEHEADMDHLKNAAAAFDSLCRLFPKDFQAIDCAPEGQLLSVADINDMIWERIKPLLPEKPSRPAKPAVVKFDNPKPEKAAETGAASRKLSLLAVIELAKASTIKPELEGMVSFTGKEPSYFAPKLEDQNRQAYSEFMEKIAGYREDIRQALAAKKLGNVGEALGLLLPMAAYANIKEPAGGLATAAAQGSLKELRNAARLDDKPAATAAKAKWQKIAEDGLSGNLSTDMEPVTLLEAWPRNEFDLLSDSLYGLTDLPRQQLQAGIENWTYDQKYQALTDVLVSSEVGQVRYRWDVVAEQGLLVELALSGMANNLRSQPATPRYGYDVPEIIENAGLEGEYLECFDLSLALFSQLQASKDEQFAPYVTLGGHKVRFQFGCELTTLANPPAYMSELFKAFRQQLLESVAEHHPIVGEWLKQPAKDDTPKPPAKKSGRSRPRRRRSK